MFVWNRPLDADIAPTWFSTVTACPQVSASFGVTMRTLENPVWTHQIGLTPGKSQDDSAHSHQVSLGERLFLSSRRAESFRNASGVYMKLMNFRRLDPEYTAGGRMGLTRGAKGDEEVWREFAGRPRSANDIALSAPITK